MTTYRSIISDDATGEEAAVIAAAISIHLRTEEQALIDARDHDESESWAGRRWAFSGRMAQQHLNGGRVPLSAPTDEWTAAGRTERY